MTLKTLFCKISVRFIVLPNIIIHYGEGKYFGRPFKMWILDDGSTVYLGRHHQKEQKEIREYIEDLLEFEVCALHDKETIGFFKYLEFCITYQ